MQESSPFELPASPETVKGKRKENRRKASRTWRPIWAVSLSAGLLAVVLFAAFVLTWKTPVGDKRSPCRQK
jgi:hypothetical protein